MFLVKTHKIKVTALRLFSFWLYAAAGRERVSLEPSNVETGKSRQHKAAGPRGPDSQAFMESILERTGMTTIRHLDFNWLNWIKNVQTWISGDFSQVWPFWSEVTTPCSVNFTMRVCLHVLWRGLMDIFSDKIHQSGSVWTGQNWSIAILPSLLADTWTIPSWGYSHRLPAHACYTPHSRLCCSLTARHWPPQLTHASLCIFGLKIWAHSKSMSHSLRLNMECDDTRHTVH